MVVSDPDSPVDPKKRKGESPASGKRSKKQRLEEPEPGEVITEAATHEEPREEVVVTEGIYGRTVPLPEPSGPRPQAWRAVLAILALLVTVPLGLAVVMSQLDDHLRGRPFLGLVVVTVVIALITGLVRLVVGRTTRRR